MSKWSLLVIGFTLFLMNTAFAATTGKIAGVVKDAKTEEPLPGVNIVLNGTKLGAATDLNGEYFIINVPPGNYKVTATMIGYKKVTQTNVKVKIDQTTPLNFLLEPIAIAGQEITIVAERPPVEIDLTASKEVVDVKAFELSWINTVDDAVEVQSGVNIHGGVRGSLGLEVAYLIDGMDARDMGSNSTFLKANTTSIKDMEVLTGGWNAEYPQAAGAIVNIITKRSMTRWGGSAKIRFRPAGKYHWGRNLYSHENMEWKVINKEYFEHQSGGKKWNDYWTHYFKEQDPNFDPNTFDWASFNWQKYQEFMTPDPVMGDYTKRSQWESEASIYGPLTSNLDILLSARYLRGVNKYPSALAYNPEWNTNLKLNYNMSEKTRIMVNGFYQSSDNTGNPKLSYYSSQDMRTYGYKTLITSAFDSKKWNPFGDMALGGSGNIMPPQYIRNWAVNVKATHVFNPKTYMEFSISHNNLSQKADFLKVYKLSFADYLQGLKDKYYLPPTWFDNKPHNLGPGNPPGDAEKLYAFSHTTQIKLDLVSQIHRSHLVKAGLSFSPQYINKYQRFAYKVTANIDDYMDPSYHPYEGAAYVQDKIETKGMIINAGLRFDFFNVNKKINYDIFDPMALSDATKGNKGIGIVSFDPDGPYAVKTKVRYAVSPRLGVSHPITKNTVLHFMYGHFNQRPAWVQIGQNPLLFNRPRDPWITDLLPELHPIPDSTKLMYMGWKGVGGNPALDYQKVIQYEVGFDQNIANIARLDVTLYYKDGSKLTNLGFQQGNAIPSYGTSAWGPYVQLRPDPNHPTKPQKGVTVGYYTIPVNGGRRNSRGLEFTLETNPFQFLDLRAVYNMSWVRTAAYGPTILHRRFLQEDGTYKQLGIDRYAGGNMNINEVWNPAHTLKVTANLNTPIGFGPSLVGFKPLSDWNMNVYFVYASPQRFTYHSVIKGDFSTEPRNQSWKPFYKTNLTLSKGFKALLGNKLIFQVEVINLFNNKILNLPSGQNLVNYMEYGELPHVEYNYKTKDGDTKVWREVNEWGIYRRDLMPREIFFGLRYDF